MSTKNGASSRVILTVITSFMMFFTVFAVLPMTDSGKVYGVGETAQVTASSLNVRSGAGTGYSRIGSLGKGKTFTVTGTATDSSGVTWYKLNYNSRTGYVSSKYVNIKQPTVTSVSNMNGTVNTAKDPLIVRSGPSKSYGSIGTLAKGKTFAITGKSQDSSGTWWYRLNFGGKTGYVSSAYVKTTSTSSSVTTVTDTTGTVATQKDPLTIRSGPGTGYSSLGTLAKGKTFTVTGKAQDSSGTWWYTLSFNGKTGYASSKYVTVVTTTPPAQEETVTPEVTPEEDKPAEVKKTIGTVVTQKDPLTVRKGPGKNYGSMGTIKKGSTFEVTGSAQDTSGLTWYTFNFNGKTGYVSSSYVTVKTEGTAQETPVAPENDKVYEAVTFQMGTVTTSDTISPTPPFALAA